LLFYRHKLGDLYIKEMVRRNILPLVLDLLIVFGFAGILVLIWRLVKFEFYVPSGYLPPDNVFDIGFYIEKIKEMIRQSNSQIKVNYMPFAAMLQSTLRIAWILTAFIVAGFVDLILSLRIAKSAQMPKVKLAVSSFVLHRVGSCSRLSCSMLYGDLITVCLLNLLCLCFVFCFLTVA